MLSTLKSFHIEGNEEPQDTANPEPKEFNPDRWLAEFQLRKAKHTLWGIDIREEIEQITAQRGQFDNEMPIEVMDARLEELYCASDVHSEEAEELANEEDAIQSFDWNSWEIQKEMNSLEKERKAEERDIAQEMKWFVYLESQT